MGDQPQLLTLSGAARELRCEVVVGADPAGRDDHRLRAELEASERKLNSERDILRAAAKYFAGETRW